MELDRKVGRSIYGVKGEIYKRTGVGSTRLRQKMRMEVDVLDCIIKGALFIECEGGK